MITSQREEGSGKEEEFLEANCYALFCSVCVYVCVLMSSGGVYAKMAAIVPCCPGFLTACVIALNGPATCEI